MLRATLRRRMACMRKATLDEQIAWEPAMDRIGMQERREALVARPERFSLAGNWERALKARSRRLGVPVRVRGAEPDIQAMIAVLRSERAVDARGVALAETLLTDGSGPLYREGEALGLAAYVRSATALMLGV